jgi:hypothetical protein
LLNAGLNAFQMDIHPPRIHLLFIHQAPQQATITAANVQNPLVWTHQINNDLYVRTHGVYWEAIENDGFGVP